MGPSLPVSCALVAPVVGSEIEATQGARWKYVIQTLMFERKPRSSNFVKATIKPVPLPDTSLSRVWMMPLKRQDKTYRQWEKEAAGACMHSMHIKNHLIQLF